MAPPVDTEEFYSQFLLIIFLICFEQQRHIKDLSRSYNITVIFLKDIGWRLLHFFFF